METNVILCDICEDRVAKRKCGLCDKDICESGHCMRNLNIIYKHPFKVCSECIDNLHDKGMITTQNYLNPYKKILDDFPKLKELEKELMEHIRNRILIRNLDE